MTERLAIISVVGDGMRTLRGISANSLPHWPAPISTLSPLLRDLLNAQSLSW
ncbi:hypothetical protein ACLB1N_18490 [Escherichia coli]